MGKGRIGSERGREGVGKGFLSWEPNHLNQSNLIQRLIDNVIGNEWARGHHREHREVGQGKRMTKPD